ncbi:MAG TPA: hypothetical protein VMX35_15750 [Acidobacteriota bacterium]|nr:hypothetical protein [Acidobacteriota bacterium]
MPRWGALAGLLIAAALLSACTSAEPLRVELGEPQRELHGVLLTFEASEPLAEAALLDSRGETVLKLSIPALRSGELFLPSQTLKGGLTLAARSVAGATARIPLGLPALMEGAVEVGAPFPGPGGGPITMPSDPGGFELFVTVYGRHGRPLAYSVTLAAADGLLLAPADGGDAAKSIVLEGEVATYVRPLRRSIRIFAGEADKTPLTLTAAAALSFGAERREFTVERQVIVIAVETLRRGLAIAGVEMPVSHDGRPLSGRRAAHIALSGAGGGEPRAVAYQAVAVENRLEVGVPVVVRCEIFDTGRGEPAAGFGPPGWVPGRGAAVAAFIPAGSGERLTLPLYADKARVEPGRYERRLTLEFAGSGMIAATAMAPLEVERPQETAVAVTAASVGATLLLLVLFFLRGSRFIARFTTRQIVLVALVASASVVMVNLPVFFIANITLALLGPLGLLVDALLTGFLFNALLVALLAVIPRQGVCALVVAVRFLLGGLLLGMLTPLGALHAGVSALALEGAVWLSGVTRKGRIDWGGIRLLLSFALANALISWVGFQLSIVLFRLHYAGWYIALSVLVGGFLYSLLGATVGRRIGGRLAQFAA